MRATRRFDRLILVAGALALILVVGVLVDAVAGPLDPPGSPSSTMSSLSDIGDLGDEVSARLFDETLGSADNRSELYVRITDLPGDATTPGFEDASRVMALSFGGSDPGGALDLMFRPLTLRINVERNWPLLYRAMLLPETLDEVVVEWLRPDIGGVYYSIELTNARIVEIRQIVQPKSDGSGHIADVSFVSQSYTVTNVFSSVGYSNTWPE